MGTISSYNQVLIANMAILSFKLRHNDFIKELSEIILKYQDDYFVYTKFSLVYKDLFRIILERDHLGIRHKELYNEMQKNIRDLKRKYGSEFLEFQELVRDNDIGYNNIVRLILGESANDLCNDKM
ncbi:hypothetical protein V6B95_07310 [Thermoanaerobacterium saccharolyticum]|uniref:hypothetical protein n=1 Tax=Thermoanaerobacterium saccharolyticum TaxID=28896 RepID=UPI002FD92CAA